MNQPHDPTPDTAALGGWLRWAPLLIVAVAWVAHASVRNHGWVLDDVRLVRDNPDVARGPAAIPGILAAGAPAGMEHGTYGPLAPASFALEAPLWRRSDGSLAPAGFHLTNLLLHGLCALLLFRFLLGLVPRLPVVALVAALVFAAHPLHTGAVATLMGRAVLLAALFGLLAALAWRRWSGAHTGFLVAALLLWLLSLLSHVALIGLPLALAVLDRAVPPDGARARPLTARWGWLAFAAPLAVFLVLWEGVGALGGDLPVQGAGVRLAVGLEGLARAALGLAVPIGLRGDHTDEALPGTGYEADLVAGVGVVLVTAAVLVLVWRRRGGAFSVLWLAALALAVPAVLALPAGAPLESRWAYGLALALVPAAGLLVQGLLGSGTRAAGGPSESFVHLRAVLVTALALVCLVGLAHREAAAWQDDDAFHERLLARNPNHITAMVRLARSQRRVATELRVSAAQLPANSAERKVLLRQRRDALGRAALWSQRAVGHEFGRGSTHAWRELGFVQLERGRSAAALRSLERARDLDPALKRPVAEVLADFSAERLREAAEVYFALARARELQGSRETAADAFLIASKLAPGRVDYLFRAGMGLCRVSRYGEGLRILEEALRRTAEPQRRQEVRDALDAQRESARGVARDLVRRGQIAQEEGRMRAAATLYEQALDVNPRAVDVLIKAGRLRGWWFGNYALAESYFAQAEALLDEGQIPADDERRRRIERFRQDLAEQRAKEDAEDGK